MSRLLHEAVLIEKEGTMNSKNERKEWEKRREERKKMEEQIMEDELVREIKKRAKAYKGREKEVEMPRGIQKDTAPVLVGNDVESLFPSIQDLEAARMVRCLIQRGDIDIKNFDHRAALCYIRLVGGKGYLSRIGLGKLEPRWKGGREDLTTLGGDKSRDLKNWRHRKIPLTEAQKRMIEARTIEIAILTSMNNHLYSFGGKVYIQTSGGPIGLRFTACLAAVLMKIWDRAWLDLLEREGIETLLYKRYVDDSRNLLCPIAEGWRWNEDHCKFMYTEEEYASDTNNLSIEQDQD